MARSTTAPVVVVVDDDLRVRESLKALLESAGYETSSFNSAGALLKSGMLASAGCLIADVHMPEIDGFELYRRVRQERADLPILFISGRNEEHARQFAIQVGAPFFDKPFQADDILRAVHTALIPDGAGGQV
jgi:FixJ family two-component response regulator